MAKREMQGGWWGWQREDNYGDEEHGPGSGGHGYNEDGRSVDFSDCLFESCCSSIVYTSLT